MELVSVTIPVGVIVKAPPVMVLQGALSCLLGFVNDIPHTFDDRINH